MSENPFQPPQTESPRTITGVVSGRPEDLYAVAKYQRYLMVCILGVIASNLAAVFTPPQFALVPGIAALVFGIASLATTLGLAIRVYGTVPGILMGILAIVPCLGLLILLLVNVRATKTLQDNGIKVGFMGADLSQVPQA